MSGTKIMVLKMREIIKTLLFAAIGIAFIFALIYFFLPREKESTPEVSYVPGTYSASISLNAGKVELAVTVSEDAITNIELNNFTEAHEIFYPLLSPTLEQVTNEIIENQTLDITLPSENMITGQILLSAVNTALALAEATPE